VHIDNKFQVYIIKTIINNKYNLGETIMKSSRFLIFIIMTLMIMHVFAIAGTDMEKKIEGDKERISKMSELNNDERIALLIELGEDRIDVQNNLIHQFVKSDSEEIKFAAAFLLGFYRMEDSVKELSSYISLENKNIYPDVKRPLWDKYPIVEALIRIGKPSISEMLKNIKTSNNEKVIELSIRVIRYVEGPEIGRVILEKELAKQTDTQYKNKFEAAIKSFDKLVEKTTTAIPN
jgi:hypothetical protein